MQTLFSTVKRAQPDCLVNIDYRPAVEKETKETQTLASITIILITSFVFGEISRRLGFPTVVGQIIGGIFIGIPQISSLVMDGEAFSPILDFMSKLGIVFLLFLAGLEIEIDKIKESSRDATLVSFFSAIVPFVLGFLFIYFWFPEFGIITAMVFGGAIMVTSEGTNVKVLLDLNCLNTKMGAIILAAGAVDDIFEVLFLSLVVVMSKGGNIGEILRIPLDVVIFLMFAYVGSKIINRVLKHLDMTSEDGAEIFSIVLISVMLLAVISEALDIGYLIGSIFAGFIMQLGLRNVEEMKRKEMIRSTKLISLGFIVPFFFVDIGLKFDMSALNSNLPLLIITIIIAFAGKIIGTMLVKPFSKLSRNQLYYIGWAMNSRGAAELVIALIAMESGVIPLEVFTALVAMSIVTTLTFPIVLTHGIKRHQDLMD